MLRRLAAEAGADDPEDGGEVGNLVEGLHARLVPLQSLHRSLPPSRSLKSPSLLQSAVAVTVAVPSAVVAGVRYPAGTS